MNFSSRKFLILNFSFLIASSAAALTLAGALNVRLLERKLARAAAAAPAAP